MTEPQPVPIEIICGVDANYAPHLGVLLQSIASSNKGRPFRIHILHDSVDKALQNKVALCAPGMRLEWYEVVDHQVLQFPAFLQITRAAYLRLALAEILPETVGRALYLDVDIIVDGNLAPLWDTDLGDKICGAVIDPGMPADKFQTTHGLMHEGHYFNSGMILFDLNKLRAGSYLQKSIGLLSKPDTTYEFADQDVLNIVLWNQWHTLDNKWNFQRKFLYDDFKTQCGAASPIIIHYTEAAKPWCHDEWHPYAWLYLKNLRRTPFKKEVIITGKIDFIIGIKWWLRYMRKRVCASKGTTI